MSLRTQVISTFYGRLSCVFMSLVFASTVSARTITITAESCDEMACISALVPRLSWAMGGDNKINNAHGTLYFNSNTALFLRFPIKDLIPKGQRITKAELTIAPNYIAGIPEINVRRLLAEWGSGVCYQYRMTYPQKIEWSQPGARGNSSDRANKNSATFKFSKVGEQTADVTEDIELWYTGASPNRGWIFTMDINNWAYFLSPYSPQSGGSKTWKLQISFEPL